MGRLRLLAVAFIVAGLACAASAPVFANILIQIDKPSQTMTVSVDGQLLYRWPVSTGATGFSTPDGSYTPFRMEVMHYSQEWDNAGMPHAIFFSATTLYDLVTAEGMGKTTVIVRGDDPPGYYTPSQPPQQKRPFTPFGGLFRF